MYLLLAILLFPVQALAIPLSYNFSGTLGGGGSISGSMSYDPSAPPIATDVRGLLGNQVYGTLSWDFTIHSTYLGATFKGDTLEFCTGKCIFGTLESTTIRVGTSGGVFQMGFNDLGLTSLRLTSSHFKFTNNGFGEQGFLMLTSGQATRIGSVPLPSTFFLFAAGFGLILCFRQWCSNSMRRLSNQDT
jgi:hypothetical protein